MVFTHSQTCSAVLHLQKSQTWSSPSLRHQDKPGQGMGAVCATFPSKVMDAGHDLASSTDLVWVLFQVILQWNCCSEWADGMCSISPGLVQVLLFFPCRTADRWMHWRNNPPCPPGWQLTLSIHLYTGEGGRLLQMGSGRESC